MKGFFGLVDRLIAKTVIATLASIILAFCGVIGGIAITLVAFNPKEFDMLWHVAHDSNV